MQSFQVLSALGYSQHLVKCWPLFHLLYFVYLQLYFSEVIKDDKKKKDKMRIWCNFVLITGALSMKNTPKYLLTSRPRRENV